MNARRLALEILEDVERRRRYVNIALPRKLETTGLSSSEKAFVTNLVMTTVRMKKAADWLIDHFLLKPSTRLPAGFRNLLRLGLSQLLFLPVPVPSHAAVHESVKLAKEKYDGSMASLANALLRRADRARHALPWPAREPDYGRYLAVTTSHPEWLVELCLRELGSRGAADFLKRNNVERPLTVRVNTLKNSPEELRSRITDFGVKVTSGLYVAEALRLMKGVFPRAFLDQGSAYVQDEASMLVVKGLGPARGDTVLDFCSAPGGKASMAAALMRNEGRIVCVEKRRSRAALLARNLGTLGVDCAEIKEADAADVSELPMADRVLVDAPCSGLGTLFRKADLRWRLKEEEIGRLSSLQKAILANAWRFVKPGGRLVYSVCTISRQETTDVTTWFLGEFADVEELDVVPLLGVTKLGNAKGALQLLPHIHETDGMFIAAFTRQPLPVTLD